MKKNKLIRGNVKRAIAVASAFMMMCNPVLGAPLSSVNSAHAEETAPSGESEKTEESESSGESEKTGESKPSDEPEKAEESEPSGESEKTEESEATDESEKVEESEASDDPEKGEESNLPDESDQTEENDAADEPDQSDAEVGEEAVTGNTKPAVQQTALMIMRETGLWYVEQGNYIVEDGYYYLLNESGEKADQIKDEFIEVKNQEKPDGCYIIYVDDSGRQVKNQWLGNESDGFRYVNSKGKVIRSEEGKVAGGYFGDFAEDGYWTARTFEFFETEQDDGTLVKKYAGETGEIAGVGEKENRRHYCFEGEADQVQCFLLAGKGDTTDKEQVKDIWIENLRVNAEGYLIVEARMQLINHKYYNFDEEGRSELVTDIFIYDEDGSILCYMGEDGAKVTNQFVSDGEHTYYFGEDGALAPRRWIEDKEGRFRYVDGKGRMVVDTVKAAGGYYGEFDSNGYWKPIAFTFFQEETGEGSSVIKYSGEEAKVAGIGEKDQHQQYFFVEDGSGATKCGLLTKDGAISDTKVAEVWIDDLRVDVDGYLIKDAKHRLIDSRYYDFDEEGHSNLVKDTFIYDTEGTIICYVGGDGEKVTNEFVSDNEYTYYFGEDGTQVFSQWIKDSEKRRYVDEDGHLVVNITRPAGGYYGAFDTDGDWTAIEHSFFKDKLTSGDSVTKYAGAGGEIAGTGEEDRQYYGFVTDENGTVKCCLISKEEDIITQTTVANIWIDDLWVDADGHLVTNTLNQQVGNKYYNFDEEGHSALVTNTFIYDTNGTVVCYVGEDGEKVTNKFVSDDEYTYYFGGDGAPVYHQWIDGADGRFRYVDGEGHLVVNQKKIVGGYYGTFDKDGYWTAIEHEFFESKLKDGTPVTKYVGAEGKVAAIGDKETRQYYCFVKDAAGMIECGLISKEEDTITEMAVANVWIDDLWVDDSGHLVAGTQNYQVGEYYYNFDGLGHGKLVTNAFIYGTDGKLICYVGEDGRKVADRFVSDGVYTYYFKADGTQAFHQWIDDADGRFRYVDGKGHLVVNKKKVAGGYYGSFDRDGYWTAIEYEFFTDELNDGTSVTKYAGNGGKVAGVGEKENRQHYSFKKRVTGEIACCLISEKEDIITETAVSNVWIEDMWVNADGFLVRDAEEAVDGVYYYFDQDGHGTVITYKISYVLNGGTNSGTNPVNYTGAMDTFVLEAPTRAGYTFGGWFTDRSFINQITEIASKSHGDLTLYAKWIRNNSGSDSDSSDSGSSDSSNSSDTSSNTTSNSTVTPAGTTANSNPSAVTVSIGDGQNVVVQTGGTSVSASAVQTAEGSVSGNMIVTVTETATVPVADGKVAEVATIAVGTDGSTRTLLASPEQGAKVQQVTVVTPQGVAVTQNVVVYTDGTQITQKSGATELEGFADTVASSEQAIQKGTQTIADVYNDKVDIDLQQYTQVGSAVTYAVTPGVNGAVPQTQIEQTSFAPGQEVTALITDANGNVKAVTLTVGANGIVQYEIPGVNCIVRFMRKKG